MARQRSPARDEAKKLFLNSKGTMKLVDIAAKLNLKDSQIRKWKSQDNWDDELGDKSKGALPTSNSNVTNGSVTLKDEISWIDIENEYITKHCTLEYLASKFKISFSRISKYSTEHEWISKRKKYEKKVKEKSIEKTIEKESERIADRNLEYLEISDMMASVIKDYIEEKQYKKHVVKYKNYIDGKADSEELVSQELDVMDTKAFSNMVTSLDKIQKGQRLAEGLDKPNTTTGDEIQDDGFIQALEGTAAEDWSDENEEA